MLQIKKLFLQKLFTICSDCAIILAYKKVYRQKDSDAFQKLFTETTQSGCILIAEREKEAEIGAICLNVCPDRFVFFRENVCVTE